MHINVVWVIIEFVGDLPIPPQSVGLISELEVVHGEVGEIQS